MYALVLNSFISAFLLFQIQPILGKILLPVFGGGASIWSATLLSFQLLLLGGYIYAYLLTTRLSLGLQTFLHSVLVVASCGILLYTASQHPSPIIPPASLISLNSEWPTLSIVTLIILSVGLPYFVLSSNSTLMQYWLVKRGKENPYWMYSFSNAGSSLALVTYPFVIEPIFGVRMQGWIWSALFMVFAVLTLLVSRAPNSIASDEKSVNTSKAKKPIGKAAILWWLLLSFLPSMLLLAVTAQITQEVAPIPFLWVGPLFIYLLSFIFTFSSNRLYTEGLANILIPLTCSGLIVSLLYPTMNISAHVTIVLGFFFVVCWFCHGELFSLRPPAEHMQFFYVIVATGGALGGTFVSFLAPQIFNRYYEFYIGLFLLWCLLTAIRLTATGSLASLWQRKHLFDNLSLLVTSLTIGFYFYSAYQTLILERPGYYQRNFYGVIRVAERSSFGAIDHQFVLYHGTIIHGSQYIAPARKGGPLSYYPPTSGVGIAVHHLQRTNKTLNVGVLGLGVGTMAVYGREGDTYHFFEINPQIRDLALGKGGFFSYLEDSPADIKIHMGDGRLTINGTIAPGTLDLLLLDAFSSDAIPIHLLTLEAINMFMSKLKPDGIMAIHISNKHLYLEPNIMSLAKALKLPFLQLFDVKTSKYDKDVYGTRYMLLSKSAKTLVKVRRYHSAARVMVPNNTAIGDEDLWTDDYSNLYRTLW